MPNKRDPNKTKVSAWVDKETKRDIQRILDKKGLTLTDEILKLFNSILNEEIENEKSKKNNKQTK